MHITVVLGTARTNNHSQKVSRAVYETFAGRDGVSATHASVKDYVTQIATMPDWGDDGHDEGLQKWEDLVGKTDGFVFVLPEYNRGYPGEWKLLVDSTMKPYLNKPAALVGVSAGMFGGSRVVEHVKTVLVELGLIPLSTVLNVGKVADKFGEDGMLTDDGERERMDKFVDMVINDVTRLSCSS